MVNNFIICCHSFRDKQLGRPCIVVKDIEFPRVEIPNFWGRARVKSVRDCLPVITFFCGAPPMGFDVAVPRPDRYSASSAPVRHSPRNFILFDQLYTTAP